MSARRQFSRFAAIGALVTTLVILILDFYMSKLWIFR